MRYCNDFRELLQRSISGRNIRTFGFEYELLGEKALSLSDFERVRECLPLLGYNNRNGMVINSNGMYITFEPGGQLEFSSPPLRADQIELFDGLLAEIAATVDGVLEHTGVKYIPVDFMPGRDKAPMLLSAQRYHDLHDLLGRTSDRGRDMMKGTAAIHLHVSICNFEELLRLWEFMCSLSREEGFAMGPERRDIWNRTDPSRCGLTCSEAEHITSSEMLLDKLILFALRAVDLHGAVPFEELRPLPGFKEFLVHFTTIFTDVRLNTKGMTLELRTPDSRPLHMFRGTWITFLDMVQRIMDDNCRYQL
jgi:gamma-glutamylcysteine synthetase